MIIKARTELEERELRRCFRRPSKEDHLGYGVERLSLTDRFITVAARPKPIR
jgi:hypothetical protein